MLKMPRMLLKMQQFLLMLLKISHPPKLPQLRVEMKNLPKEKVKKAESLKIQRKSLILLKK